MIPIPIRKVLSTIQRHQVRCLLMGGQASVLYGAVQFSKDVDLAVVADSQNLSSLQSALDELGARRIAVPPFEARFLEMGLAVHFRTNHPEARDWRVDVLSRMRNVDPVEVLWTRRTTYEKDGETYEIISLPDLIRAKKTQRDKDWPVIARLVEHNYLERRSAPSDDHIAFWGRELRSASSLVELATAHRTQCGQLTAERPLLNFALAADEQSLRRALLDEQFEEQEKDRLYWQPLRRELERLRREERNRKKP